MDPTQGGLAPSPPRPTGSFHSAAALLGRNRYRPPQPSPLLYAEHQEHIRPVPALIRKRARGLAEDEPRLHLEASTTKWVFGWYELDTMQDEVEEVLDVGHIWKEDQASQRNEANNLSDIPLSAALPHPSLPLDPNTWLYPRSNPFLRHVEALAAAKRELHEVFGHDSLAKSEGTKRKVQQQADELAMEFVQLSKRVEELVK
ncbi:hypothetical protein JCM21900_001298 [Sporobolomyces salmonicolor]